jgi:putative flippase GtrA
VVRAHRAQEVLSRVDGLRPSEPAGERPAGERPAGQRPASDHGNISRRAQLLRFACVGIACTVAFVLLYLALRTMGLPAQAANLVCQFVTAVLNTTVNRRVTFGIRGTADAGRHQVQGLIAFGAGVAVTSAALAVLHAVSPTPARIIEVTVLVAATLVATVVRFVLYRFWVFRPRQRRK